MENTQVQIQTQDTDGQADGVALNNRAIIQSWIDDAKPEESRAVESENALISIVPSVAECERFIQFLNHRFSLDLPEKVTILIHETSPRFKGYFRPKENLKSWCLNTENKEPLNSIVLSSHSLTETPFETLAHELAHYINHTKKIKDCSNSQYHNKHFKEQAEKLLLEVKRLDNSHGYAFTFETPEFKEMLNEFKPSQDAFKIFQNIEPKQRKAKSRLLKYSCSCGCIIRTAKNEEKPLNAVCQYCNTQFKQDGESDAESED